jgi:hypothetical protein
MEASSSWKSRRYIQNSFYTEKLCLWEPISSEGINIILLVAAVAVVAVVVVVQLTVTSYWKMARG